MEQSGPAHDTRRVAKAKKTCSFLGVTHNGCAHVPLVHVKIWRSRTTPFDVDAMSEDVKIDMDIQKVYGTRERTVSGGTLCCHFTD